MFQFRAPTLEVQSGYLLFHFFWFIRQDANFCVFFATCEMPAFYFLRPCPVARTSLVCWSLVIAGGRANSEDFRGISEPSFWCVPERCWGKCLLFLQEYLTGPTFAAKQALVSRAKGQPLFVELWIQQIPTLKICMTMGVAGAAEWLLREFSNQNL